MLKYLQKYFEPKYVYLDKKGFPTLKLLINPISMDFSTTIFVLKREK